MIYTDKVNTLSDLKRFLIKELQGRRFKPHEINALLGKILRNVKTEQDVSEFMKGFSVGTNEKPR